MNVFDFAIEMENEGEVFYQQLSNKTPNAGLKAILNMLAADEVKHGEILKRMKNQSGISFSPTLILHNAKNLFQELREKGGWEEMHSDQTALYKKAQDIETRSMNFYLEKSKEIEVMEQKNIFLSLAEEEKRHFFLLEQIILFVSRPKHWLENAEFNHLEEY